MFVSGAGQPHVQVTSCAFSDIMYTSIAADGTLLPPVIFTSDQTVPANVQGDYVAHVFAVNNFSGKPSADTTLRWLDTLQEHLAAQPFLVHDKGSEFIADSVQVRLGEWNITNREIPAVAGAFVNPLDNSFHHEMKSKYRHLKHRAHSEMIRDMIIAYYQCCEVSAVKYFKHCLLVGRTPSAHAVQQLCSEGYAAVSPYAQELYRAQNLYRAWLHTLRLWHTSNCAADQVTISSESPECVTCWRKKQAFSVL
jgi:hypothetical protein